MTTTTEPETTHPANLANFDNLILRIREMVRRCREVKGIHPKEVHLGKKEMAILIDALDTAEEYCGKTAVWRATTAGGVIYNLGVMEAVPSQHESKITIGSLFSEIELLHG